MKLNIFCHKIEKKFPLSRQTEGDNSGKLIGDDNREIKTALICLDINKEVIDMAITNLVDIIVSHHPFSFNKTESEIMAEDELKMNYINRLKKTNIAIYSAHTSCDAAKVGMNEWLAQKLSLVKVKKINSDNIGVIGELIDKKSMKQTIQNCQRLFNCTHIRTGYIDNNRQVSRIAIIGGSGGEYIKSAIEADADIIVTSDVKWHQWHYANDQKITVIDVGHYMEQIFVPNVTNIIKNMGIDTISHSPDNLVQIIDAENHEWDNGKTVDKKESKNDHKEILD